MDFRQLILILLSITFLVLLPSHTSDASSPLLYYFCGSTGNYSANSTYNSNLQTLFNNLTTSATSSSSSFGFAKSSVGSIPNEIFGIVLCRGDISSSDCSSCILQATQQIQNLCPYNKESTIYYDFCLLRFTNEDFLLSTDNSEVFYKYNGRNVSVPIAPFHSLVNYLLNSTADYAALNDTKKFGTSLMNLTNPFPAIWGLTQCTPDLSGPTCLSCLQNLFSQVPNDFNGRQGGRFVGVRCNFRYEIYSFYEGAALLMVAPPAGNAPAPAPALAATVTPPAVMNSGPQDKKKTSTGTIMAITIPLVVAFVAIAGFYVYFLKTRKSAPTKSLMKQHKGTRRLLVLTVSPVAALLLLVFVVSISLKLKLLASVTDSEREKISDSEFAFFNLRAIKDATSNFSEENKLGEGGFGPVYKGMLSSGQEIAVKRLSKNSQQGLVHLRNEVMLVAKLEHKNLVRLLGCCLDGPEKLLVYEYLCNTSLDKFLFDPVRKHELVWLHRYNIIEGIGRGLLYLHQESRIRIIHRDLKASNILLDSNMNPKISDFGLAKMIDMSDNQENTRHIAGTYGYMAPEYAMHGLFSEKSDVFSYGVLVLEIMTGRSNSSHQDLVEEYLLTYVWHHWIRGVPLEVVDRSLIGHCPSQYLIRYIHVGLLCVQVDPSGRPTIDAVLLMLSSQTMTLPVPSAPAFIFHTAIATASQNNKNRMSIDSQKVFYTDVFSEMEPR